MSEIDDSGDVRKGLNIIRNAVKIAESKELKNVSKEEIDVALSNTIPNSYVDLIGSLSFNEILFLFSIMDLMINTGEQNLLFKDLKQHYEKICDNLQKKPRKNTQLWIYLQHFSHFGLVKANVVSKNIKGRKSIISNADLPIHAIHERLNHKIRDFNSKV